MILKYNYFYFVSALSPQLCDAIIEFGLEKMAESKKKYGEESIIATTGNWKHKKSESLSKTAEPVNDLTIEELATKGVESEELYVRDSNVSWITEKWMYEAIWPFIHEANKQADWNFEWDHTEDMQFTKYSPGQFYGWHADTGTEPYIQFDPAIHEYAKDKNGNPILSAAGKIVPLYSHYTDIPAMVGKQRKLSVTVSLSDPKEYDGGNLKFDLGPHRPDRYHTCEEIRPRGSIIVFPSHIHHQVTPVTRGTRYSLVAWNLGKPFR
jgi:PKHD-type hydroxylase